MKKAADGDVRRSGPPDRRLGLAMSFPWHALEIAEVTARLGTDSETGLSQAEAQRRLERVGLNRVAEVRERSLWRLALGQFRSLVVLLLLAAASVAWALNERLEALAILAALLLNAGIRLRL